VRNDGAWYVHATTERPAAERVTHRQAGALGVDLNPDRVAVAEIDRSGNPVAARDIRILIRGRRKEQVLAALGDAVVDVMAWARGAGKRHLPCGQLPKGKARRAMVWLRHRGAIPRRKPSGTLFARRRKQASTHEYLRFQERSKQYWRRGNARRSSITCGRTLSGERRPVMTSTIRSAMASISRSFIP